MYCTYMAPEHFKNEIIEYMYRIILHYQQESSCKTLYYLHWTKSTFPFCLLLQSTNQVAERGLGSNTLRANMHYLFMSNK